MKKIHMALFVLLASVVVSGCSLVPSAATEPESDEAMVEDTMMKDDSMEAESDTMMEEDKMMESEEAMMMEKEEITLDSFSFGYSEDELMVEAGQTITLTLTNSDGFHDFVIDELDVATKQIKEGETDTVTFTIPEDASGKEYAFYCSVGSHRAQGMEGMLIVK